MSKRDPGPLLAAGRSADVYLLGAGRVVRRYREPYAADFDARREAEVMTYARERASRSRRCMTPTGPTSS